MEKEHKKAQMIKAENVVATDYICDICKKRIYTDIKGKLTKLDNIVEYYNIASGHNDWGNDSIESRESSIVCKECLTTALIQYKNAAEREPYNSRYIEVEHKYSYDDGEYKEQEMVTFDFYDPGFGYPYAYNTGETKMIGPMYKTGEDIFNCLQLVNGNLGIDYKPHPNSLKTGDIYNHKTYAFRWFINAAGCFVYIINSLED